MFRRVPTDPRAVRKRRGSVLVLFGLTLLVAMSVAGVAFDIVRTVLVRRDLALRAEEISLTAAMALDGSEAGLSQARVDGARVAFSESQEGPWISWPERPDNIRFVRATVSAGRESATARAGQIEIDPQDCGEFSHRVDAGSEAVRGNSFQLSYGDPRQRLSAREIGSLIPVPVAGRVSAFRVLTTDQVEYVGGYLQGAQHPSVAASGYFVARIIR